MAASAKRISISAVASAAWQQPIIIISIRINDGGGVRIQWHSTGERVVMP